MNRSYVIRASREACIALVNNMHAALPILESAAARNGGSYAFWMRGWHRSPAIAKGSHGWEWGDVGSKFDFMECHKMLFRKLVYKIGIHWALNEHPI